MDLEKRKKRCIAAVVLAIILALGFAGVTWLVTTDRISAIDDAIRYRFYAVRSPALSAILIPITYLGNWQSILAISVILLLVNRTRKSAGLPSGAGALISHYVNHTVKGEIARARPSAFLHLVSQSGYSFPSGHSMTGLFFYGMLIYSMRRIILDYDEEELLQNGSKSDSRAKKEKKARAITIAGTILIIVIGLSRIYVGVHFPSDVLAGWLLGGAVLFTGIAVREMLVYRELKKREGRKTL